MAPTTPIAEALDAVRGLTSEQIRERLAQLAAEAAQLRVLLRAARARERREATPAGKGVPRA
jgi:hypothetical protein